ncbi:hypothetical protein CC86DRAFT_373691 [Ophiobolus disseminans]|uniref:Uncharacterized protein n=1 Tax=Ophiobolus disseminans TaxID=1469910 RepID=A0A6A6ZKC6_9PLEO|nr:hypothetical protein CC86DRAFT_373691 [Ophiobolus disseminans]
MLVNKTPATKAAAATLNFDTANPFDTDDDIFESVKTQDYSVVLSLLTTTPVKEYEDVAVAKRELKKVLGDDTEIIERLPTRLSQDPNNPGQLRSGDPHKPASDMRIVLSILMEFLFGVLFCCDGCGVGKTHEYISHIIAVRPILKRTLVVCLKNLVKKT